MTKDGVIVAKQINPRDPLENVGAQMVKEVASMRSDIAGDGTTTATVLAQAIYREGAKNVFPGVIDPHESCSPSFTLSDSLSGGKSEVSDRGAGPR